MSGACYESEDLDDLVEALRRGDHPQHLDDCPRCRSLLASYRAFLDPPDVPAGSDPRAAAERLRFAAIRGFPDPTEEPKRSVRRDRGLFALPWWRPVAVAGLLLLVAGVSWQVGRHELPAERTRVLRGSGPERGASLELLPPLSMADGGLRFMWRAIAGAQSYELVLYKADLTETDRRSAGADTTLSASAAELAALAAGRRLYWQVVAHASGAEIARSAPRELVSPSTGAH